MQVGVEAMTRIAAEEQASTTPQSLAEGTMVQLRYNLIYQSAALHALPEARDAGLGVAVMRPMTSGMLQRILHFLNPEWSAESYAVALQFVLSDSRVHVANVGMRWPEEVDRNVDLVERFEPPTDFADLPRLTAGIYRVEDQEAGLKEAS